MKKIGILSAMIIMAIGAKAQDCEALVRPYFGNDQARMDRCPADKQHFYCLVAQAAFYESDTVPAGVQVFDISTVKPIDGIEKLTSNYVVDLNRLSYFGYNFRSFQMRNGSFFEAACFATPASKHPYLVLRSYSDMMDMANEKFREIYK